MGIKIVIDSASDINETEANEAGLILLPMEIKFDKEEYLDGVTLLPTKFYEKLIESDILPKTSQINPYRFEETFDKIIKNGDECVVITIPRNCQVRTQARCKQRKNMSKTAKHFGKSIQILYLITSSVVQSAPT